MADRRAKPLARIDLDRVRDRLDAALDPVPELTVEGRVLLDRAATASTSRGRSWTGSPRRNVK